MKLLAVAIGVTAALLLVYFTRPSPVLLRAAVPELQAPATDGKGDRLPPLHRDDEDAPLPDRRGADDLRPVHDAPSRELPARDSRNQQARQSSSDPVCGVKGRTWYSKANGWRYWRCNRPTGGRP
jgi:hypothetical protein